MRINMEDLSISTHMARSNNRVAFSYNIKVKWYKLVSQAIITIRIVASNAPNTIQPPAT